MASIANPGVFFPVNKQPYRIAKFSFSSCFAASTRARASRMTKEEFLARPIDEEWEKARRQETADLERRRREEDEEEVRLALEYRRIGSSLKNYPQEEVNKARRLVANLIKSGEEIEEMIVEAGDNEELTPLLLLVIKSRLELARQDDEREAVEALDLLHRRVEYEIMKRQASPSMRLLNELLNLHDGTDDTEWLRKARHRMLKAFPPEHAFTILAPRGFDLSSHHGPIDAPVEGDDDDVLLRIDFIREVNQLVKEVEAQIHSHEVEDLDTDAVALRLRLEDKKRNLQYVKDLLEVAIALKW
ncbi:protein PALE CRESS, chloroplastic [Selaginella moellendorffii]|nr:protein PALE CRESS, chloroplastic [Selaginella moellendorffii]|eukprot:XP_002989795.2 protein PALE CRESS, chloroplastic [Selaginella moellendorffii]